MITSSTATLAPYSQNSASFNFENPHVYDLPWITRAVTHHTAIRLQQFLDTLLPEYSQASTDSDRYIEETIHEYSGSDPKTSFPHLFKIFTENANDLNVGDSKESTHKVLVHSLTEFDLEGKKIGFNGAYNADEGRFKDVWHCLAKRASDALSTGMPRHHIFGVYVKKDCAYFLYYDHSVVMVTKPLNWVKDAFTFWKIIYTMSNVGLERMGFAEKFFAFQDHELLLDGMSFQLTDVVQTNENIIGECSSMVHARFRAVSPHQDQPVTIRFNFIPRGKGWKYEANVVSDLLKKDTALSGSLPVVIASKAYPSEVEERIHSLLGDTYVTRELRVTVYAGTLYPVTTLTNDLQILRVIRDVMRARQRLFLEHSYFHRALTPDKIVFRRVGSELQGVLLGYELSAHCDEIAAGLVPSCLQSVESLPFVSPDLLNNFHGMSVRQDWRRYELESVYYVLFFIVTHYENGKRVAGIQPPFKAWFADDHKRSAASKMQNILAKPLRVAPTPSLAKLAPRVIGLHASFHQAYNGRIKRGVKTMIGDCACYEIIYAGLFWDLIKEEESGGET